MTIHGFRDGLTVDRAKDAFAAMLLHAFYSMQSGGRGDDGAVGESI